ncbi:hypothetical protein MNV_120050 [Candidatus Methanoperedens nitroreducens]|uniref:Uncharacterized protein n=1 Tax=Candidatus Methanoperedens nitratireducens TaxID=1392998 RepID=A0A284VJQ4_9EURY|nr:hypothetical protein MNV_120050 [Candidatus Methanoperedens nitroreducens]
MIEGVGGDGARTILNPGASRNFISINITIVHEVFFQFLMSILVLYCL